jgi:very-short-patch-repair endonuclease
VREFLSESRGMKNIRVKVRQLRRDQTDAEQTLWARLRDRQLCGAKFRRQHPVGPFVADFCCPQRKLVVELDGGQHAEKVAADHKRSRFLEEQGYRVLRFWNHDVLQNPEAVLERIAEALNDPHPCPLPGKGEGEEENPVKPNR